MLWLLSLWQIPWCILFILFPYFVWNKECEIMAACLFRYNISQCSQFLQKYHSSITVFNKLLLFSIRISLCKHAKLWRGECFQNISQLNYKFKPHLHRLSSIYLTSITHHTMTWIYFNHHWPFVRGTTVGLSPNTLSNKLLSCQWFGVPSSSCDVTVMWNIDKRYSVFQSYRRPYLMGVHKTAYLISQIAQLWKH